MSRLSKHRKKEIAEEVINSFREEQKSNRRSITILRVFIVVAVAAALILAINLFHLV